MFKKYVNITNIVTILVILLIGYCISLVIPSVSRAPITVIKYNGQKISTGLGDHNWLGKNGGSSYDSGGDYTVGLNTAKFLAKPNDKISITIPIVAIMNTVSLKMERNIILLCQVKKGNMYLIY